MGQGLGKNSPVVLTLGKANYEALLQRHGQWTRWRIASKCGCVKAPSMQPDIHCKFCGGRGYIYTHQSTQTVTTYGGMNNKGIIQIEQEYINDKLLEVYDNAGQKYNNAEKYDTFIYLNSEILPPKGTFFNIVLERANEELLEKAEVESNGYNYYEIEELINSKSNIEGVYYGCPSDIISIEKITDANGKEYKAEEFRLNKFLIKPQREINPETGEEEEIAIKDPIIIENIKYVKPFIFAILNQNLSKADIQAVNEYQGDAVVTFPYGCDVANDDVLTVLAGSYTQKEIIVRTDFETDTLGVYFVQDILSVSDIGESLELINYEEGKDFVLLGTNKIKWINEDNSPLPGEAYSVTYKVYPTYKVVREIPQLRTSENQRFPKKAVVKLVTTYSENLGLNKQVVGRKGIMGNI